MTEIAFLTLPNDAGEDAKTMIEDALVPIMGNVTTIGKCCGAAIGWGEFSTTASLQAAGLL